MSLFAELKRRNVFRVGAAYGIATWVLMQIVDVIAPLLFLPEWAPTLILVILAVGFIPALIFAWAFEMTPEGLKKEKEVDRTQSITDVTGRKLDFAIIGVLLIAIGLLVMDRYSGDAPPGEGLELAKSIAVLPFVNMSSDTEQEFFSDGITEEILNALAAVKELKVAGRTSSFAFKGQNDDLRKIGDTLGVEHILEGSVRKAGTTVRITAQLIQVEDGFHMWSETYDRELTDIFAIQDEIASEILNQLKAKLLDEELDAMVSDRTDPEVYDLYLLAKQRIYRRTRGAIESAAELLDQAIAKDPNYAPAHAQRAVATMLLSDNSYGTTPQVETDKAAKKIIDRAIELDPQSADAWAALGLYHTNRPTEHEEAIAALTKALSINPNLVDAGNWLQIVLQGTGDARGSLEILEHLTARDPLYRPAFGNAVTTFNQFGMEDKAAALIEQYARFDPNDAQLLRAKSMHELYKGNAAAGAKLAEEALKLEPTNNVMQFTVTVAQIETLQIERIAEEANDYWRIEAMDAIGRRDEAVELAFERAADGDPHNLFRILNRAGRHQDLVNYLEERWPGLDAFAADHPHDDTDYGLMSAVALAYSRSGNSGKFDQSLTLLGNAMDSLAEQGVDNWVTMMETAKYLVLAGDHESALGELENSLQRGLTHMAPLAKYAPEFEPLADDPRFLKIEAAMIAKQNNERAILGLDPVDPYASFWQYPELARN